MPDLRVPAHVASSRVRRVRAIDERSDVTEEGDASERDRRLERREKTAEDRVSGGTRGAYGKCEFNVTARRSATPFPAPA